MNPSWPPATFWHLVQWAAIAVGATAAFVGGLWAIWTKGILPAWHCIRKVPEWYARLSATLARLENYAEADITEQLTALEHNQRQQGEEIKRISDQVRPNGGSSLHDVMRRVENRQLLADRISDAMLEDAPHGIFRCTLEGENTMVNRTYCRGVGASDKSELLRYGWKNFLHPDYADEYQRRWSAALADQRDLETTLVLRHSITHEAVEVTCRIYIVRDHENRPLICVGSVDFPTPVVRAAED